ncbi:MAG: sulfotransferase [Anaerolineae bacterium]|nr:sulfotransferase [Gemmatimonadaceae bacterium]
MRPDPIEPEISKPSIPDDTVPRARKDPARDAVPGQELVYETIQTLWSAWARRRYRDEFDQVATFCLFIGYPRSGHSLVGAMLNAHRNAVISHELDAPRLVLAGCTRDELYSRILSRAAWFNLKGNRSNYSYQFPNQWQGRFTTLRVIGDKRGGSAAQLLGQHPDLLDRLRTTVGVPLRLVHVVRNPFDNIAAIARWHKLPLDESVNFYFSHCETTGELDSSADRQEMITIRHEDLISWPEKTLALLCDFLGLKHDPGYLADCTSIVFQKPTQPRHRTAWTAAQVAEVERRAKDFPFLDGYSFDATREPSQNHAEGAQTPDARDGDRRPTSSEGPGILQRVSAYFRPRVRA